MLIRTANASRFKDESDAEYRRMFEEALTDRSVRDLTKLIASLIPDPVSHASWDKYMRGNLTLSRRMKNELRLISGVPPLLPTVEESLRDVHPDATVAVLDDTEGELDFIVVGNDADPRWAILEAAHKPAKAQRARKYKRPLASLAQNERRIALGVRWSSVIEIGLAALERELSRPATE
jgi:hypothetical protein